MGPLVIKPILPPKPTTMFRNSVGALEPLALTLTLPTALQVDTSDAFLVSRTLSEPGTGATATTQEISPTAEANETTTIRPERLNKPGLRMIHSRQSLCRSARYHVLNGRARRRSAPCRFGDFLVHLVCECGACREIQPPVPGSPGR